MQGQLKLEWIAIVLRASYGWCWGDLRRMARGPLDPPTCLLVDLSIEADEPEMLRQACEFLTQTTFPNLETLRLEYSGVTSNGPELRLPPTVGLQKRRLPKLKLLFLGPLPTSVTGTIPASTEVFYTGEVRYGCYLDKR